MTDEFRTTRMVEFFETDMAGIMHFSNFFRFMESAEHAFYRSIGFSVDEAKSLGLGWPRVKAECEYRHPLRFEDIVEIRGQGAPARDSIDHARVSVFQNGGRPRDQRCHRRNHGRVR